MQLKFAIPFYRIAFSLNLVFYSTYVSLKFADMFYAKNQQFQFSTSLLGLIRKQLDLFITKFLHYLYVSHSHKLTANVKSALWL
jgi:hypothetical protein